MTQNKVNKKDFVELEFTGSANGIIFDSNIKEDLEKVSKDAKPQKTIVVIGEGMVVKGLDMELENKEIGKLYEVKVLHKNGFGQRKGELVRTIPLHVFTQQKINPIPGSTLFLDNNLAKVITVSGARVITDFNNPLAGKDLDYKFTIKRLVTDEKEKAESLFLFYFKFIPKFEVKQNKIMLKGPVSMEDFIKIHKQKFKDLLDKELMLTIEKEQGNKKERSSETPQQSL
jgi:FKBP-type peptidyl-prolyl cis-trans isomerase SlyD